MKQQKDIAIPDLVKESLEKIIFPPLVYGCGYTESEIDQPRIGIANTWSELNPGHIHLNTLMEKVKEGLRSVQLTPFAFNTIGPCDAIAEGNEGMHYILPAREVITSSIEIMARAGRLDGLVLIGSCDKIVPALLMAAARLDIPSIIVTGGYALPYCYTEKTFSEETEFAFPEIGKFAFARDAGKISEAEFQQAVKGMFKKAGACPELGTAMTMQCMVEVLGMTLPYSAIKPGESSQKLEYAFESGKMMSVLLEKGITPSKIMTMDAFKNAITVLQTLGGSSNGFLHLPAVANELGFELPMGLFDEIGKHTPQTCAIKPNGPRSIQALDEAGGIPAVLKNIQSLLNCSCINVTGRTIRDLVDQARIEDETIIHPLNRPVASEGGLVVLNGNLAPEGAIVKKSSVPQEMQQFRGPARIFESEEEAIYHLYQQEVKAGECIVIRGEGPKGGPGMREMSVSGHLVQLLGLGTSNALITDGRFSGTNYGLCIGHISPEAADRGVISVLRDGDMIVIDISSQRLDVALSEAEIRQRMENQPPIEPCRQKGILSWYARNVTSAAKGAVIDASD